jgi:hypothetical protein
MNGEVSSSTESSLSVVACVSDDELLQSNLLSSECGIHGRSQSRFALERLRGARPHGGNPQMGTGTGIHGRSQSPFALERLRGLGRMGGVRRSQGHASC